MRIGRKKCFILLSLTRGGGQLGILRFTVDIFVYKYLQLVIGELIGNIVKIRIYLLLVAIGYLGKSVTSIKSNF